MKKDEEAEKLASLKQGGIYHFRSKDGVFKTAVIFPLHEVLEELHGRKPNPYTLLDNLAYQRGYPV